jgi:hypothetical protein
METYFKLKLFFAIIPIVLSTLFLFVLIFCSIIAEIKRRRIEKFFLSHGYARKLLDVPRFGSGAFYGWVRESDNMIVDDRNIKGMSLKEIREKCK